MGRCLNMTPPAALSIADYDGSVNQQFGIRELDSMHHPGAWCGGLHWSTSCDGRRSRYTATLLVGQDTDLRPRRRQHFARFESRSRGSVEEQRHAGRHAAQPCSATLSSGHHLPRRSPATGTIQRELFVTSVPTRSQSGLQVLISYPGLRRRSSESGGPAADSNKKFPDDHAASGRKK
jgi:hypothetical protein